VILYPHLQDPETGYIRVMIDYLPASLRGLMVAAFAAAFMSTVGTQLNWGASYLVNDFYRRFIKRTGSDRHYVIASQFATVFLTIVSAIVTWHMESIGGAWKYLIATGAGTGAVYILRWYWWRINAWSEVSAMICAAAASFALQKFFGFDSDDPVAFAHMILITVGVTTAVWLATTFLTAPESEATLLRFYRKVRPSRAGWGPVSRIAPDVPVSRDLAWNLLDWLCGCVLIYAALFGIGSIILADTLLGIGMLAIAAVAGGVIYWDLSRRGWSAVME
jgi:Na+/proline symporter